MGQAFYRKYRPKLLADVVGQEHITTTISRALAAGNISHAYLLSGPRGVGKTSIARILAHEVNGIPYDDESMHLDIIEIDAASNRGIEEIRDLREKVHIAPTSSRYKVYIIDEVHMLTAPAFNALLKTLEEPPAHVIFILATTESHKLPDTIISRTQRFSFRAIENDSIIKHLKMVAKKEHITIDDAALGLIAQHGQGSFRDSLSLLDQASSSDETITADTIRRLLGVPSETAMRELLATTLSGTLKELLDALRALQENGYRASIVANQLTRLLRTQLLGNELAVPPAKMIDMLHQLLAVPAAPDSALLLEITLIGFNLSLNQSSLANESTMPSVKSAAKAELPKPSKMPEAQPASPIPVAQPVQPKESTETTAFSLEEHWPQVLATIKTKQNTLYSILRMADPRLSDDELVLSFTFAFHQKKMNEDKSRQIIREILAGLTGSNISVICVVDKTARPFTGNPVLPATTSQTSSHAELDTISNIFGGAEVLE